VKSNRQTVTPETERPWTWKKNPPPSHSGDDWLPLRRMAGYVAGRLDPRPTLLSRYWPYRTLGLAANASRIAGLIPAETPKARQTQNHMIYLMNLADELQR
jgi:hypothetical protein